MAGQIGTCFGSSVLEVVYASSTMRPLLGLPGIMQESPVDLARFRPRGESEIPGRFVAGSMSRDTTYKFHPDDAALFAGVAKSMEVRLIGETLRVADCSCVRCR